MKGLLNSKTVAGVLLGVLGILLGSSELIVLPEIVVRIVQVVGLLITAMGLRDTMLEQQGNIAAKIIDFKSKTFWGVFIEALVHLTEVSDQFEFPEGIKITLQVLGAVAITLGLRDAAQRAKAK